MANAFTVQVLASGTPAAGVGPHYQVLVDGTSVGDATAGSQPQTSTFTATLAPDQPHDIQVVYDNDDVIGNEDRNLSLQSITVNGHTIQATDSSEVYHATGLPGEFSSDGNMYWDGAAEFSVPASDFTSQPASPPSSATTSPSTPTTSGTPALPSPAPATSGTPAFYVSTSGSDRNDGSAAHPFATLAAAKGAMESSSTHLTYVEGGTYTLSSPLVLGQADSGMRFEAAPGQTAVLDGSNAGNLITINGANGVTLSGLSFANTTPGGAALQLSNASDNQIVGNDFTGNGGGAILMTGSSGNTVSGNEIDNSGQSAVEVKDGSNNNTFDSNRIDGAATGFYLHGVNGNAITHNQVENTAGFGIGVENWDDTTINVGNTINYNIVKNADTSTQDDGSIYMLGRSHVNTQSTIIGNVVDGTGGSGDAHTIGIYLDDSTTGVTVENNIVRNIGTHGVEIHGGDDITVQNNIFDLGANATSGVLFQAAPADTHPTNTMLNDDVLQNIFYGSNASQTPYSYIDGGNPNISNNLYYNTTGASMAPSAPTADSNPSYGDPKFVDAAAGNYALQPGSAAAAIGFQSIDQSQAGLHPTTAHWYTA